MAPPTLLMEEPEMQDTPPCQYQSTGIQLRLCACIFGYKKCPPSVLAHRERAKGLQ